MDSIYGFRKIIAALVVVGVGAALVYLHGDVPPGMQEVLQWVFAAFVVGNGVEHITDAVASKQASPQAAAPEAPNQPDSLMVSALEKLDTLALDLNQVKVTDNDAKQSLSLISDTLAMIIRKTGLDKAPDTANRA